MKKSMRPLALVALAVTGAAMAIVSCSSFGGTDTAGENSGADGGADVSIADASTADSATAADASPGSGDAAALAINLCTKGMGTVVLDDDMSSTPDKAWQEKPSICPSILSAGPSGTTIECKGVSNGYDTLTTRDPLSSGEVAVNIRFVIEDTGDVPDHIFAQVLQGHGPQDNLTFTYSPATLTVTASGYKDAVSIGAWTNVAMGTVHVLRIGLPAATDGGIDAGGPLLMSLDDMPSAAMPTVARVADKLQIGPYITATGDARDRYLAVRTWLCN